MRNFFQTHTLLAGAIVLTASGFLSRILGFFYRIFLSRAIGAEGLGLYQTLFPLYGICFSLCAGSIQTAISRFAAARPTEAGHILRVGFSISFSLSLFAAAILWRFPDFLASRVLLEPRLSALLPMLALTIPCTSIHACVCGYYYGKQQVQIPALSQLAEQGIRIGAVLLAADICAEKSIPLTASLAAFGLLIGEAGAALFSLLCLALTAAGQPMPETGRPKADRRRTDNFRTNRLRADRDRTGRATAPVAMPLLALAAPLMANRLVMNLLQSAESILIPARLTLSGLTRSEALSLYGVLTGMSMSFVLFPSALINSLAVVLLPSVAHAQSSGNNSRIGKNLTVSFRSSLWLGILCIGLFASFGEELGLLVFQNRDAGVFISVLAWLCPFLYLATTMGSILNGLGQTHTVFLHNLAALLLRLGFVWFGIPRFGILACLWGMLAGELSLALLHFRTLSRMRAFSPAAPPAFTQTDRRSKSDRAGSPTQAEMPDAWDLLVKPAFCLIAALGIGRILPDSAALAALFPALPLLLLLAGRMGTICAGYGLLLLLFSRGRH